MATKQYAFSFTFRMTKGACVTEVHKAIARTSEEAHNRLKKALTDNETKRYVVGNGTLIAETDSPMFALDANEGRSIVTKKPSKGFSIVKVPKQNR